MSRSRSATQRGYARSNAKGVTIESLPGRLHKIDTEFRSLPTFETKPLPNYEPDEVDEEEPQENGEPHEGDIEPPVQIGGLVKPLKRKGFEHVVPVVQRRNVKVHKI